jgi:gliding motility-associated-like protein
MVNPDGGSCSVMLGDYTAYNYGAASMRKTFLVSPGNAVLTISYAAVLEDGGHTAGEQPFFRVRVYNQSNNELSCGTVNVYANDGQPGWNNTGAIQWRPWTNLFIPLSGYIGQNITIEFTVGDCSQGGHYAYAYVEASCNPMSLTSNSGGCSGTVNLQAPPGAASYQWNTGATTQSINVTTSGYYSVQVIPVTGPACAITLDTNITINANPPTPNFTNNAPVCYGTPVSFQNTSVAAPGDPITQYSWDFGDGSPLNNQQNPQHTYTNPAGGNYNVTLTITTQGGCVESITYPVTQPPQLTTPTNSVIESCPGACNGQAIVAPQGGVQPYTYAWTTGGNPIGGNNPALTNLCAGNYSVVVTDNMGCTQNANINVGSGTPPTITNIAVTHTSCPGSCDGSITITAGPNVTQYSVDNGVTFQAGNVFNNQCAGNYNIVVQDANGCQATGNAQINSVNTLNIIPGPNQTICIGQSTTISVNGNGGTAPLVFIWDNGLPNGTSHNVNPASTTVYSVYVQDANGCTTPPVQITVNVHPPLQVVALQDQSICPGQQANITAQAAGGNGGPYTYTWTDGVNNYNGQNQTVSPTTTTVYTVTATDNCTTPVATDQVTITVNPVPNVTFTADNLQGCSPVAGTFTNNTDPNLTGSCLWDFGNGVTSNNCNPTYNFTQPGCYNITLTVTSPQGCVGTLTQNQYICVWPNPVADFIPTPQPTNILSPQIQFTNTSQGATIYSWDFAGLGNSNDVHPVFTFPDQDPGTYMVCLQVENQYGCIDDICKPVIIDDYFTIYVPNAFTPTGDGINDIFIPIIDGIDPESYEFMIFNRWGELIFQTNNPQKGWDGTHRGVNAQQDVYVWKIIVKDAIEHKKRTYYGHVTLLR